MDICCVKSTSDLDLDQCAKGTVGASWIGGARQALDFSRNELLGLLHSDTGVFLLSHDFYTLGPRLEGCAYPSLSGGMKLRW